MENIKHIYFMLKIYISMLRSYFRYKKNPLYSFFIIRYPNKTSEIVLYKNAMRLKNSITCYNMYTFNKLQKDDMFFELDDWNNCIDNLIPVWNFQTLYRFIKMCKNREQNEYLYEYSLIVKNKDLKKFLRHKVLK